MKELSIAVFIDHENLALGARELDGKVEFQIELVLKKFLEKGRIVFKKAYSDWSSYRGDLRQFHALGIEMVDIPRSKLGGKNSADIRMVVDAIDLCHTKDHVDIFALVTGDSDFSPLVSKLKENDKRVIGCGIRNSSSQLLVSNCDDFIFYDDLIEQSQRKKPQKKKTTGKKTSTTPQNAKTEKGLEQVIEIIESLQDDYDPLWGSLIKQTVRRIYPDFRERALGYKSFSELLRDLEKQGQVTLEYDPERGNHKVSLSS